MQAGRELDAKVAEALGWRDVDLDGEWFVRVVTDMYEWQETLMLLPEFSATWAGMGILVEEARKQQLEIALVSNAKGHWARVFTEGDYPYDPFLADHTDAESMPFAVAMAYLKAMGIEVTA